MRIRKPFAGAFVVLALASAYLGLAPNQIPSYKQSDKVLHLVTFFLLTLTFYWILETSRRRCLNLTLIVCTAVLGVGSEVLQDLLPNGRSFDYLDIAANITGSVLALGACAWYHTRMLERKRAAKTYHAVAGDEEAGAVDLGDVELAEGISAQENGTITTPAPPPKSMEQEVDDWDENGNDDWDEAEPIHDHGDEELAKPLDLKSADTNKRDD